MSVKSIQGLYAILDPSFCGSRSPFEIAQACLAGGARILQWREKKADRTSLLCHCLGIASFKNHFDFLFIVNDDPHIAAEVGADGVHLGQNDRSVEEARKIVGRSRLIGRSTHSLSEVKKALKEDIDYLALGAIFPTASKPTDHPVVGLDLLSKVAAMTDKPVVAIGGINRTNIVQTIQTGASACAMISALSQADNVEEEARFFSGLFK